MSPSIVVSECLSIDCFYSHIVLHLFYIPLVFAFRGDVVSLVLLIDGLFFAVTYFVGCCSAAILSYDDDICIYVYMSTFHEAVAVFLITN